ncbi:MAG: DDE-type integrase/transposase/recombinase [Myxococcaceae bacterium]|nr:DDE-type integrase/transposase/recombinase [Myxococcaceae bacterium]
MKRKGTARRRQTGRAYGRGYTPQFRLRVVKGVIEEHLTPYSVARVFGITDKTMAAWLEKYRKLGDAGLGITKPGPKPKGPTTGPTRDAVVALKRAFPYFGAQKISDSLKRFEALGVSPTQVRRILHDEGLLPEHPTTVPKAPPPERRFERAEPNQMWQSDIFEFWLRRHQKLYVTAFLDDNSRFIVSHVLAHHHKASLVIEGLERGVAAYGVPREVLTDNGRQYTAWRGETAFEQLLKQYGIRHIKSSPQHPMTLGKTERFWKTLWEEFLSRTVFSDFADCERRMGLFVQAYNFKRPHQGIGGLVPADRFFRAAPQVREAIEKNVTDNSLRLALEQPPVKPFYLVGRLGDRDVSIAASGSGLRVQLGDEQPQTIHLPKESHDEAHQARFTPSAPSAADSEVAQPAAGPRRDGAAPDGDGAARVVGGAGGDGRDSRREDFARHVLPARDEGAAGDAARAGAGSGADRNTGGRRDGEANLGARGAGEATAAGEAARGAAALPHQEAGEEGADGFSAARAAEEDELILLDEAWGRRFDELGDEQLDAAAGGGTFDVEQGWREHPLSWPRKLAGENAPGGVDERRAAEAAERLPEGPRGAAGAGAALRSGEGRASGPALGDGGGEPSWLVSKPISDAHAPGPERLAGGTVAEAAGPQAETSARGGARSGAGAPQEGERSAEVPGGHSGPAAERGERSGDGEAATARSPGRSGTEPGGEEQ